MDIKILMLKIMKNCDPLLIIAFYLGCVVVFLFQVGLIHKPEEKHKIKDLVPYKKANENKTQKKQRIEVHCCSNKASKMALIPEWSILCKS